MRLTMPLSLKLAVRNVFRNRRRTVITLAAMGFGAAAIIVFGGFVHAIYFGVRESTIRSQIGHIQLYRRGYSEKGNLAPYDYFIRDYGALRAELAKIEHVKTVTARLGFSGLVSTGDTTASFVGTGVDPDGETDLSSLAVIVDGKDLVKRDPRGVTLGVGLARAFGVKPGDDLTLLTTTKGGGINALAVQVRGAWESGEKAYDDRFLRVGITEVQRLLDIEHDEVQSIVLLLDKTENTPAVRATIERLIAERGLELELQAKSKDVTYAAIKYWVSIYYDQADKSSVLVQRRVPQPRGPDVILLQPTHPRVHVAGATLAKSFDALVVRGELAATVDKRYETVDLRDRDGIVRRDTVDYLVGIDYTLFDVDAALQVSQKILTGSVRDVTRGGVEGVVTTSVALRLTTGFFENAVTTGMLFVINANRADFGVSPRLDWNVTGALTVSVGVDIFEGAAGRSMVSSRGTTARG
jgi:hypothetical protein